MKKTVNKKEASKLSNNKLDKVIIEDIKTPLPIKILTRKNVSRKRK